MYSVGGTSHHENILTLVLHIRASPRRVHFRPAHPYRLRLFRKLDVLSDRPLSMQVPRRYPYLFIQFPLQYPGADRYLQPIS